MAEDARLVQERSTNLAEDNSPVFRIINTLTHKGPLADHGVFVFQIVNEDDVSLDTFYRVADVADLSAYRFGRNNATQNGDAYYRISGLTLTYDNFSEAEAAATTVKDRVDTLVTAWITSSEEWIGSEAYTLPATDPTIEETYINAYSSAYQDYVEALVSRDEKQAELDTLQAEIERYTVLAHQVSDIRAAQDALSQTLTTLSTYVASMDSASCSSATGIEEVQDRFPVFTNGFSAMRAIILEADTTQEADQDTLSSTLAALLDDYTSSQNRVEQTKRESDRTEQQLIDFCPNTDVVAIQNAAAKTVATQNVPAVSTLATA